MRASVYILFILVSQSCFAQQFAEIVKEDTLRRDRVLASESFTYYGLDFSHFNLVNGKKIGTEGEVLPFIPSWIDQVNKYFVFDDNMSWYTKRKVEDKQDAVQRLYLQRTDPWITFTRTPILLDSIQKIVRTIAFPETTNEIALVVIVGAFVKDSESSFTNFVFFDTKTKDVLWRIKIEAYNKNRGGMSGRWGDALKISYKEYFNYWMKETRKFEKNK